MYSDLTPVALIQWRRYIYMPLACAYGIRVIVSKESASNFN
jgi:hypothetical protein